MKDHHLLPLPAHAAFIREGHIPCPICGIITLFHLQGTSYIIIKVQ